MHHYGRSDSRCMSVTSAVSFVTEQCAPAGLKGLSYPYGGFCTANRLQIKLLKEEIVGLQSARHRFWV